MRRSHLALQPRLSGMPAGAELQALDVVGKYKQQFGHAAGVLVRVHTRLATDSRDIFGFDAAADVRDPQGKIALAKRRVRAVSNIVDFAFNKTKYAKTAADKHMLSDFYGWAWKEFCDAWQWKIPCAYSRLESRGVA